MYSFAKKLHSNSLLLLYTSLSCYVDVVSNILHMNMYLLLALLTEKV